MLRCFGVEDARLWYSWQDDMKDVDVQANSIGSVFSKEDKQKMAEASQRAYESEQPETFSNPNSGVSGKAEVVQAAQEGDSSGCKTIRQTVVLKDGKTVTEDVKSCKNGG